MVYKTVRCWLDRPSHTLLTQEILDMLGVVERAKEESKQPLTVFFQRDLETLKQFARDERMALSGTALKTKLKS